MCLQEGWYASSVPATFGFGAAQRRVANLLAMYIVDFALACRVKTFMADGDANEIVE